MEEVCTSREGEGERDGKDERIHSRGSCNSRQLTGVIYNLKLDLERERERTAIQSHAMNQARGQQLEESSGSGGGSLATQTHTHTQGIRDEG